MRAQLISESVSADTDAEAHEPAFLSEDKINDLLKNAESRLRAQKQALTRSTSQAGAQAAIEEDLPNTRTQPLDSSQVATLRKGSQPKSSSELPADGDLNTFEPPVVQERRQKIKKKANKTKATAGPDWFDLPRTEVTPEVKRDFQLLRMRSVLDPKRHYKKDSSLKKGKLPAFFQTGIVQEGPTEFFSSRLENRDRRGNFVEEVLADESSKSYYKDRYGKIQKSKTSGKRQYYKDLKAKRSKIRR